MTLFGTTDEEPRFERRWTAVRGRRPVASVVRPLLVVAWCGVLLAFVPPLRGQTIDRPELSTEAARREAAREVAEWFQRVLGEVETGRLVIVRAEPPLGFLVLDPALVSDFLEFQVVTGQLPASARTHIMEELATNDWTAVARAGLALREATATAEGVRVDTDDARARRPPALPEEGRDVDRIGRASHDLRGSWRIRFIVRDTSLYGRMTVAGSSGHEGLATTVVWDDGNSETGVLVTEDLSSVAVVLPTPDHESALLLDGYVDELGRRLEGVVLHEDVELGRWDAVRVGGADRKSPRRDLPEIPWTESATHYRGRNGQVVSGRCPPLAGYRMWRVWGTGVYTDDSGICTAAVHAGVLDPDRGGVVSIRILPGRNAYPASTRNGVASRSYGRWHGSFEFVPAD